MIPVELTAIAALGVPVAGVAGFAAHRLAHSNAAGRHPGFSDPGARQDAERDLERPERPGRRRRPARPARGRKTLVTIMTAGFFYLVYVYGHAPLRTAVICTAAVALVLLWKTRAERA